MKRIPWWPQNPWFPKPLIRPKVPFMVLFKGKNIRKNHEIFVWFSTWNWLLGDDSCHEIGSEAASPIANKVTQGVGFTITIDLLKKSSARKLTCLKPEHSEHTFFQMRYSLRPAKTGQHLKYTSIDSRLKANEKHVRHGSTIILTSRSSLSPQNVGLRATKWHVTHDMWHPKGHKGFILIPQPRTPVLEEPNQTERSPFSL